MADDSYDRGKERGAYEYLRQVQSEFLISPKSGLYEPAPRNPEQGMNVKVDARMEAPTVTRPLGSREDAVSNLLNGVSLILSAISIAVALVTLIGLGFTVRYAFRQWQEMAKSTVATETAARAAEISATAGLQSLIQHDADRRPYVVAKGIGPLQISMGEVIRANISLINWGRRRPEGRRPEGQTE